MIEVVEMRMSSVGSGYWSQFASYDARLGGGFRNSELHLGDRVMMHLKSDRE